MSNAGEVKSMKVALPAGFLNASWVMWGVKT
jgi:hypothetical protein